MYGEVHPNKFEHVWPVGDQGWGSHEGAGATDHPCDL